MAFCLARQHPLPRVDEGLEETNNVAQSLDHSDKRFGRLEGFGIGHSTRDQMSLHKLNFIESERA
jgi:hypothetical protein